MAQSHADAAMRSAALARAIGNPAFGAAIRSAQMRNMIAR
jgi:hypothetical protein